MVDYTKYRQLSIREDRYFKILKEWEKSIRPLSAGSFTSWVTDAVESGLLRQRLVAKLFPDLRLVTSSGAFIIENKKTNEIVKVFLEGGKLDCSAAADKESYIIFACLHPLFTV